jgi:hypothetical protein
MVGSRNDTVNFTTAASLNGSPCAVDSTAPSGWINLATTFPRHPKALAAGPVARHLFIVGLCWAGEYDTDGAIPAYALNSLAIDAGIASDYVGQSADRLVEVGLWVRNADGWQVHDWGQWQSTSAEREERRSKNRERQRLWRERQTKEASEQVSDGGGHPGHDNLAVGLALVALDLLAQFGIDVAPRLRGAAGRALHLPSGHRRLLVGVA